MLPAERRIQIVERVKQHGTIEVAELNKDISGIRRTIRRDLRILEKKELLELHLWRSHSLRRHRI